MYLASQLSLGGRPVALKVLDGPALPDFRGRFRHEARLLSRIHHPHIAEVYAFGADPECSFIAMRWIHGRDLARVFEEIRSTPSLRPARKEYVRLAVSRIAEIASALAAVHQRKLVHGDVKPSNIMLECRRTRGEEALRAPAILVDFGLARRAGREPERLATSCLTEAYAAPEVLSGGSEARCQSDVYSLGATLHDLLAGRHAAERGLCRFGFEPLHTIVPDIDAGLSAIVGKATDLEWDRRYPTARELADDLARWQHGDAVSARSSTLLERARRGLRRHAARMVSLALFIVVVGMVAGGSNWVINQLRHARDLHQARQEADIRRVFELAREIPVPIARWTVRDAELEGIIGRVGPSEPQGALSRVAAALAVGDARSARHVAARAIAASRLSPDRLLRDWFLAEVLDGARTDSEASSQSAPALFARLMVESCDRPPPSGIELDSYRRTARSLWQDPARNARIRLLGLAALAGCGTEADLPTLWTTGIPGASSESLRLTLEVAAAIIRRALAASGNRGNPAPISPYLPDACHLPNLVPLVRATATDQTLRRSLARYLEALAFRLRASRQTGRLDEVLPGDWGIDELARVIGLDAARVVLSAADKPCARVWVRQFAEEVAAPAEILLAGRLVGMIGDPALEAEVREVLTNKFSSGTRPLGLAANFAEGVAFGHARARGACEELKLDPASTLDSLPELANTEVRVSPDGGNRSRIGVHDERLIAGFRFESTEIALQGAALEFLCQSENRIVTPEPMLLLARPGVSEFRVDWELPDALAFRRARVELWHQLGVRPLLPFCGEAGLTIELDGRPLDSDSRVAIPHLHTRSIELPAAELSPGRHTLVIRLAESSTTTYRVFGLTIVRSD